MSKRWTLTVVSLATRCSCSTPLSGLALSILPERENGPASGIHDMFRQGGIAVGVAALGTFIPLCAGLGADSHAFVEGLQKALLAGAGVAAVGAIATALLIRPKARTAAAPNVAGPARAHA